jgi:hypothetical protein
MTSTDAAAQARETVYAPWALFSSAIVIPLFGWIATASFPG